ncbi:hypothetical protein POX_g08763 [Penicillium oxalicum]|nr:hypothetical protein POX_g08763 [Penicillium oxalicum]KAI2786378.1 hypothetical protein POX_g08763 [Penicillium oxalicum]
MSLCNPIPIPNSGRENIRSGFIPELSAVDPKGDAPTVFRTA